VIREHVKHGKLVSVMTQYSLLDRRPEESTLSLLQKNNIGVVIRGSVATGLLIDKPAKPYFIWNEEEVANASKVVKELSSEKREPAQTAIQYVLQHPAVTSAIVGIRTMQQLEDAVRAIETSELNEEEMNELRKRIPANFHKEHR
jgi:aryl-alcohol dehydrogenase-like predicted oxidoreductase